MNKAKISTAVAVSTGFLTLLTSLLVLVNLSGAYSLALYMLVALAAFGLSLIYPVAGLLSLSLLTLIWSQHFTLSSLIINQAEYKIYLIDWFLLAIYARTALEWLKARRPVWKIEDWVLLVFFAWVALVFVWSMGLWDANLAPAVSSLKNYTFYPLLFFVAWYYGRQPGMIKQWLAVLMLGGMVSVGFLIYGLINGQGLWTEVTPLSTEGSRFLDFNHAFYLCLAFICGLAYLVKQNDRWSRWLAWLLPLFVAGIIGSLMRHLWLGLAVYLVWLMVSLGNDRLSFKKLLAKYLAAGVMVVALLAMVTVLAPQSSLSGNLAEQGRYLSTRVVSLFDSGDTSIAWRNTLWRVALADLMERPWSGQGLGQKVFIDMGSYKEYVELRNIHNSFLAILTQLGFVGLCLLAVLVLIWLYRMWTCKATEAWRTTVRYSALGMIIFCVVTFLFQPYLEANFFSIWWWLALGWGRAYYEGSLS